jgi:hypothetical protein
MARAGWGGELARNGDLYTPETKGVELAVRPGVILTIKGYYLVAMRYSSH